MEPQTKWAAHWNSSGSPRFTINPSVGDGTIVESFRPKNSAGSKTSRPPMGPAMPTSNSSILVRKGSRIRITAPSVPVRKTNGGSGIKYGSDASIR